MRLTKYPRTSRAFTYGPKILFEDGGPPISLSRGMKRAEEYRMGQAPKAWRVETVTTLGKNPKKVNYYQPYFSHTLYRRACWQYMFGGLLRAIFGIYCPARYWDRELEQSLQEALKHDYIRTKKASLYGIYNCRSLTPLRIHGTIWEDSRPPEKASTPFVFHVGSKRELCIRVNRLDGLGDQVDFEVQCDEHPEPIVIRSTHRILMKLIREKRITPIEDNHIYGIKQKASFKTARRNESIEEKAGKVFRRVPKLSEKNLAVPEEPKG